MTDLEKAVSKWLPQLSGECPNLLLIRSDYHQQDETIYECCLCGYATEPPRAGFATRISRAHNQPCPQPTRELGFRLLEAMKCWATWNSQLNEWVVSGGPHQSIPQVDDPDLLTAIIKAAAALADMGQP